MKIDRRLKHALLDHLPPSALVALKKIYHARALKSMGSEDERDLNVVTNLVGTGDYVVDVGANIGLYTKTLSGIIGESGRVYSIEPIPLTFGILSYCIHSLRLRNVRLLQTAVSDIAGVVTMEVPKYHDGGDNLYMARITNGSTRTSRGLTFAVKMDTLDSILADVVERIAFVKCDVEGHEWSVLRGAHRLLHASSAAWLIETSGNPDDHASSAMTVIQHMQDFGYKVYWYDGRALRRRRQGDVSVNYFFLRDLHVDSLKKKGFVVTN